MIRWLRRLFGRRQKPGRSFRSRDSASIIWGEPYTGPYKDMADLLLQKRKAEIEAIERSIRAVVAELEAEEKEGGV